MSSKDSVLQWDILLDDSEWDSDESLAQLLPDSPVSPRKSHCGLPHCLALFAACILLAGVVRLWIQGKQGVNAIKTDIHQVIEIENWAQYASSVIPSTVYMDEGVEPESQSIHIMADAVVADIRLRPGIAMAEVRVVDATGAAFSETRFYREVAGAWVRTSPLPEFWLGFHTIETEHFRIHYRHADAEAAMQASSQLDTIYDNLSKDIGLLSGDTKMEVEVVPKSIYELRVLKFTDNDLVVPSPILERTPADLSASDMLVRSIAYPLIIHLWGLSREQRLQENDHGQLQTEWSLLLRGIQLWQAQNASEAIAQTVTDSANWLYDADLNHAPPRNGATLQDQSIVCQASELWRYGFAPATAAASACIALGTHESEGFFRYAPTTLDQLLIADIEYREPTDLTLPASSSSNTWTQSIAAATLVDYYISVYGRERLPELIAAFSTHDNWDSLTWTLMGIPAVEFESGWRSYVADKYSKLP